MEFPAPFEVRLLILEPHDRDHDPYLTLADMLHVERAPGVGEPEVQELPPALPLGVGAQHLPGPALRVVHVGVGRQFEHLLEPQQRDLPVGTLANQERQLTVATDTRTEHLELRLGAGAKRRFGLAQRRVGLVDRGLGNLHETLGERHVVVRLRELEEELRARLKNKMVRGAEHHAIIAPMPLSGMPLRNMLLELLDHAVEGPPQEGWARVVEDKINPAFREILHKFTAIGSQANSLGEKQRHNLAVDVERILWRFNAEELADEITLDYLAEIGRAHV